MTDRKSPTYRPMMSRADRITASIDHMDGVKKVDVAVCNTCGSVHLKSASCPNCSFTETWKHVGDCVPHPDHGTPPARRWRAVSLMTGETIAIGEDHSRVENAAEILVGIGGFRIEGCR